MIDEKDTPIELEPNDFHGTLSTEDRTLMAIQEQLNNLTDDAKIRISRVQPVWCAGHLETIHLVDASQPLDIDGIIKRWGGQQLQIKILNQKGQIKGGGTIACFSYRPRVRGKEITESMLIEDSTLPGPTQALNPAPVQQQPQQNPLAQLGLDVPSLIKIAQGGGKDGGLSAKLVEQALIMQQQALQAQQQQPVSTQMEQFMGMFKMFGEMRSMFGGGGDAGGGGGGGDVDSMMPMLGQLLSGVMQKQQQPAPQPQPQPRRRAPHIVPPGGGGLVSPQPIPPPQMMQPAQVLPTQEHPQQIGNTSPPQNLAGLAQALSNLSSKDAAEVALQAFGDMPEDKRAETMQTFMGEMFEDDVDDSLTADDTNGYGQQINQSEIPDQNGTSPGQGWPLRANEGNDPIDRGGNS